MRISGKAAICICLTISAAFISLLWISTLFTESSGIQYHYRKVPYEVLMAGRDDPDSFYIELLPGQTIDINTADRRELEKLPGIGKKTAESIVEYRRQQGNFESIEELLEIEGFSEKSFQRIEDNIFIGEYNENSGS
ncbi:MAG: helix-hairpin-helix domain-containing protein [Oscillospiraceae bacterium]|nr:helix-hairpin-helix domain-containing protein [Oscillospiraceae bacterium]